jgi:hypothetical protein
MSCTSPSSAEYKLELLQGGAVAALTTLLSAAAIDGDGGLRVAAAEALGLLRA